jgi:hypothetical protein
MYFWIFLWFLHSFVDSSVNIKLFVVPAYVGEELLSHAEAILKRIFS